MINGSQNPIVGTDEIYTLVNYSLGLAYLDTNPQYTWHIKRLYGEKWIDITKEPQKTGLSVPFNFGPHVVGEKFLLEVYKETKNIFTQKNETHKMGELQVIPASGKVPKITKVVLFNRGARDVNKASYTDKLVARAYCVGMFNKTINFHLWEDDAAGGGHNAEINKNNRINKSYPARVNVNGIAEAEISLSADQNVMKQVANRFMMHGDTNEGAFHEFYVTASYDHKILGANQTNVDVANPDYKKPQPKLSRPQQPKPNIPQKTNTPAPPPQEENLIAKSINFIVENVMRPFTIEKTKTATSVGKTEITQQSGTCPRCRNKITYEELKEVFPNGNGSLMKSCLPYLNKYFEKLNINTCAKKAHFFAQVRVETDFVVLTESLLYSYDTLFNSDLKYYKGNSERCKRDAKQEKPIGNNAYGTRFRNRPNTDDGFNFRGRGLIMVTGRSTYEAFQKFYDENLTLLGLEKTIFVTLNKKYNEEKPEKLAEPANAVLSAIHYWVSKGLNGVVDNGKIEEDTINLIVDAINKNTSSRDKRRASYQGGKYTVKVRGKEKEKEYEIGTKKTFKVGECLLYDIDNKEQKPKTNKYAPWMPFALKEIGQKAILGDKNNPRINEYFNASTNGKGLNEATNWCGAFTSWCMVQAGYIPPPVSCRAAMWQFWKQDKPIYGSAAVIDWNSNELAKPEGKNGAVGGAGHITFVVGISKDGNHYYCVGGNQGGTKGARTVKISKYSKSDIDWFVIPPNYTPEASEYKLDVMTSEADTDSLSSTRS